MGWTVWFLHFPLGKLTFSHCKCSYVSDLKSPLFAIYFVIFPPNFLTCFNTIAYCYGQIRNVVTYYLLLVLFEKNLPHIEVT